MSELTTSWNRDPFYKSKRWVELRHRILHRDEWTDQVRLTEGIHVEAEIVHHIFPRELYPQYQFCEWNLISVSRATHNGILHEKYTNKLTHRGRTLMLAVAHARGIKIKMLTLVIGMPGTGKSTYVKSHLGGGLAYELDSIASAFRLTVPHKEPLHPGARRMAASMRSAWLQEASKYADSLFVVRTCPDIDELAETSPDKLVVCTRQYIQRPYRYDKQEYQNRIDDAIAWAEKNGIEVVKVG